MELYKEIRVDLKIVSLNVGPNQLKSLGARNLRHANKGFHLRRHFAGLHDATWLPWRGGGLFRHGSEGWAAHHAQVSREVGVGEPERGGGERRLGQRRRLAGKEGGGGDEAG